MQTQEFAMFASTGLLDRVTIHHREGHGWEIWAAGDRLPETVRNPVDLARKRTRRHWASLDTAHDWIRRHGWAGDVTVEG